MKHLSVVGQNRSLDPVPIEELADLMAKQTWVDMRVVPGGIAERVMVVALLIRRDEEEVQLEQWLPTETGDFERNLQWVHAESVWWAKPTQFERHDELRPFDPAQPTRKLESTDTAYQAAVNAVAFFHRVTPAECDAAAKAGLEGNHFRYWIMLLWNLLTDQGAREATKLFGYGSIQPFVSARGLASREADKWKKLQGLLQLRQAP